MRLNKLLCILNLGLILLLSSTALAQSVGNRAPAFKDSIFDPGHLKPRDSRPKVKIGEPAPDFSLPDLDGGTIRLRDFRGHQNVVLSFVPAAWTPVCSDQWPGYNIVADYFHQSNAILLGITVDNRPTLYSWTHQMGHLWFPVLSDFWPHGATADAYGLLRGDGTAERALVVIDKQGIIRYLEVSDINQRPPLENLIKALRKLR